jgi:ribosome-binding ATPase YchF (GTP1/OBG family)
MSLLDFNESNKLQMMNCIHKAVDECRGAPAVFSILQNVSDWLRDQSLVPQSAGGEGEEEGEGEGEGGALDEQVVGDVRLLDETIVRNPVIASLLNEESNKDAEDLLETERVIQATSEAALVAAELRKMERKEGVKEGEKKREKDADPDHLTAIIDSLRSYVTVNASARGLWRYTVGLIGKPSAGKSTFYNACTQAMLEREGRRMAAVAPHPFTTIEPNIGPGWFAGPSDEDVGDGSGVKREALHGRDEKGRRLLPVVVKDVAGLVPGAYKGRGKGNRFLNDLCDADVLVHVVDASGRSDQDGNILSSVPLSTSELESDAMKRSSPAEDAKWVREELHRWIYGNIKAKWLSVIRRMKGRSPTERQSTAPRIFQLFSGYQGPKSCVEMAALRSRLALEDAYSWGVLDLHRLVAHYLLIRFPICLALNKVDSIAERDIPRLVSACQEDAAARGEVAVPVSAMAENWVVKKSATMKSGENLKMKGIGGEKEDEEQEEVLQRVLRAFGSTGVLDALSAAVWLRAPVLCYPVSDLDSEAPLGWTAGKGLEGAKPAPLRDCLLFKPGSTVGDVFDALRKGALGHASLQGEFVRAEGRGVDKARSRRRQVGRDTILDETCCVLRIQTNRKVLWQHSLTAKGKSA